jgi:hypothetical protein
MPPSSDFIEHFKLETQWHEDHTLHVSYRSERSKGRQKLRVEERWYRKNKLGQGTFGSVWLETSSTGDDRAVKEIQRNHGVNAVIDYNKELLAMAKFSKVSMPVRNKIQRAKFVISLKSSSSFSTAGSRIPRISSCLWNTFPSGIWTPVLEK